MVKIIILSDIALKYKLNLNLEQYHPKEFLVSHFQIIKQVAGNFHEANNFK